ncbi:hypothetical protein GCM10023322_22220 [Rugosimonospora acidiphila]|uniref:DUF1707 domain-containing protein n=1 Tax=Rugosimonospora acidiphila TaxID=556531 RepID=A0ABP9RPB6_9ACTN
MSWNQYTRLARQLDELYRDDERQAADQAAARQAVAEAVGALNERLGAQRRRLEELGGVLGEPLYAPEPAELVGPAGGMDPVQALQLARQHADLADAQTAEVERMAAQPSLLPGSSAPTRNLLVYGACAAVAMVAQLVLLIGSNVGHLSTWVLLGWLCAGFPILAWIAGYFIIGRVGRAVAGDGEPSPRNPRLGLAICFLGMPVALCLYGLVRSVL